MMSLPVHPFIYSLFLKPQTTQYLPEQTQKLNIKLYLFCKQISKSLKMRTQIQALVLYLCIITIFSQIQPQFIPAVPIEVDQQVAQNIITPPVGNKQTIIQIQQQSRQQEELNSQLPLWINEQLEQTQSVIELPITQSFTFVLKSQQELIFKWNPSKEKELKLIVDVFYITKEGTIVAIHDAEETQYVEITAKNPNAVFYGLIDKVYRTKVLSVDFDTDFKYLKFTNKNSETVLVDIDVQRLEFVVSKGVADDQLSIAKNKISSIISQSKSTEIRRQHLYKWQWGFYQNEKNHEIQILGLTGIELFTILMTSIIQMYCLKGLLDNRAVV